MSATETDSAGIPVLEITGEVGALPERRLGPTPVMIVEGSREPYLSRPGEIEWLSDGRLVVEDNQNDALYLFAADGSYLRQLGDQGDGPEQFQNLTELSVGLGDSVYAYDRTHDRLSVLHPDVGFVRSVRFGGQLGGRAPSDVFWLSPDRIVVQTVVYPELGDRPLPARWPTESRLFIADGRGAPVAGPVVFPNGFSVALEGGGSSSHFYSNRSIIAVRPGVVLHGSGLHYDLTLRDAALEPVRFVRWSAWSGSIPEAELAAVRERLDRSREEAPDDYPPELAQEIRQRYEALLSPEILPTERPALDWRSYVDGAGRFWLSAFVPGALLTETAPEWHVLSAEGRPLFRFTLPPGATLGAVRGNTVLLIVTDEMDVPSLDVYELLG